MKKLTNIAAAAELDPSSQAGIFFRTFVISIMIFLGSDIFAEEPAGPPWARNWCSYSREAYQNGMDSDWDGLTDDEEIMQLALWGQVEQDGVMWVDDTGAEDIAEWDWSDVQNDVQPVSLPFYFPWGSLLTNRLWVGVNGTIGIGRGQASPDSRSLPSLETGLYPFLAVYWRQLYLDVDAGGRVWTKVVDPDSFVIAWEKLQIDGQPDSCATFQAQLASDGSMIWRYSVLTMGANNEAGGVIGAQRGVNGWWLSGKSLASGIALRIQALPAISPHNPDSDGDGAPDGIEFYYMPFTFAGGFTLDPLREDPQDLDRDGLTVTEEFLYGRLNPFHWDSDGDFLSDGYEARTRLLANNAAGIHGLHGDADNDGLTNFEERLYRTQPRLADSDGDGRDDLYEVLKGSNPSGSGEAPPSAGWLVPVQLRLGDPGTEGKTEAYEMLIDPASGDTRGFTFQNTAYGEVQTCQINLKIGAQYKVRLRHLGSVDSGNLIARPDYVADVEGMDGTTISVDDPMNILGTHTGAAAVTPGIEPLDTNKFATIRVLSRELPDGSTPIIDPLIKPDISAWKAGRSPGGAAVPGNELETPGIQVLPPNFAQFLGQALPARIRLFGNSYLPDGSTRWLAFSQPSRIKLRQPGGAAFSPGSEYQITGSPESNTDFDILMNGQWPIGEPLQLEYFFRSAAGSRLASIRIRLLGPVIAAIGDSMTYGVRRRKDGTMETPNWSNPWLSYPSPGSWNNYYGNWNNIAFQGMRGYLRNDLSAYIPWAGHPANGHGPDHCGYSGSKTSHINSLLDDSGRAYPRNSFLTGSSFTVVIYWIGVNDASGSSVDSIYSRWKDGIQRIINLRSGRGRTLIVGVTLPRLRSDYRGYSVARQQRQDSVNSKIRAFSINSPHIRYVVANIEGVPHDSNDDGLHYMSTGYKRVSDIILRAIHDGLKNGP